MISNLLDRIASRIRDIRTEGEMLKLTRHTLRNNGTVTTAENSSNQCFMSVQMEIIRCSQLFEIPNI
jgi:hypothetical protein